MMIDTEISNSNTQITIQDSPKLKLGWKLSQDLHRPEQFQKYQEQQ